jgi:8-oxo-dGTP pyrophosphatase MutT (NUDIX family)
MKKRLIVTNSIIIFKKKYLLQLRDNKKNVKEKVSWGLFGGHCKRKEKLKECLTREVFEEINIKFKHSKFLFNIFEKKYNANVHVFELRLKNLNKLYLNEGKNYSFFSKKDIFKKIKNNKKVSRITFKIFKKYFKYLKS